MASIDGAASCFSKVEYNLVLVHRFWGILYGALISLVHLLSLVQSTEKSFDIEISWGKQDPAFKSTDHAVEGGFEV